MPASERCPGQPRARFDGCFSIQRAQFAFGHGCDHPGYVGLILKPFHFPSRLLPRDLGTTSINLSHVRIGYAETAVWAGDNCNVTLSDSRLINCQTIAVLGTGDGRGYPQALTCNNCLYDGPYYGASGIRPQLSWRQLQPDQLHL